MATEARVNGLCHSRAVQMTTVATGCALALITAVLGDHAHAESNLDASYTISFARITVGDITATVVFGDTEYAILRVDARVAS
jgi:hypothetical protein